MYWGYFDSHEIIAYGRMRHLSGHDVYYYIYSATYDLSAKHKRKDSERTESLSKHNRHLLWNILAIEGEDSQQYLKRTTF